MSSKDKLAKDKIEAALDVASSAISETMDLYGTTPASANLYATMYFKDEMNLDEMQEELAMSKPSMSTNIRKLHNIGMVKKVFQRGSRRHVYVAEKDFFRSFMSFYCQKWDREVSMNLDAINETQTNLSEVMSDSGVSMEIRKEAESYWDMLENSKVYYHWLSKLTNSIRTEEIFEFLPKDLPKQ